MKIVAWNVNGLRSVERNGFSAWLKKSGADIVCIEEMKAHKEQIPEDLLSLKEYSLYINQAEKKGYSGVAVFTKEKPLKENYKLGLERFDKEGRMVELEYGKFIFIALYLPHGGRFKENLQYKLEVYKHLFTHLRKLKNKNVILAGDFNIAHKDIDLARPNGNRNNIMFTPEERKQLDVLIASGFVDTFRQFHKGGGNYTWWPYFANARERNLGWRIDYVFVSNPLAKKLKDAFILNKVSGSDHCPVGITIGI
ncbi:exodeoxyribonuclease III [Patescibacteria group bacterium]|nr:exodeoxyribonuclease III [Patescibacteria group bacterium]MCL5114727.1 exodeoxyribonuclease III [Patescibacteria group bacterium]